MVLALLLSFTCKVYRRNILLGQKGRPFKVVYFLLLPRVSVGVHDGISLLVEPCSYFSIFSLLAKHGGGGVVEGDQYFL